MQREQKHNPDRYQHLSYMLTYFNLRWPSELGKRQPEVWAGRNTLRWRMGNYM